MRRRIGYAKLGRSMPLSLENCSSLGGDVEMVPTLKLLAERHPGVDFILVGRNSGELPQDVGLPDNVINPWRVWQPIIRRELRDRKLSYPNLTIPDHQRVAELLHTYTRDEFLELDGMIMWLGQHGTTNTPLPTIKDRSVLTKPYDWATLYASYLLQGVNAWRDVNPHKNEEVLLNADARNYVKYRDGKWPWRHPVLAQYTYSNAVKHERYGDVKSPHEYNWTSKPHEVDDVCWDSEGLWVQNIRNVYSRIEISSLIPGTPFGDTIRFSDDFDRPHDFGIVVNETRREVNPRKARVNVVKEWVLPLRPGFFRGKWSERSIGELQVFAFEHLDGASFSAQPVPQLEYIPLLQTARCTFTTPASGSGWATAKPWESFAAGVVCFFHPDYDDQNNILHDAPLELRSWLRVDSPATLAERIRTTCSSPNLWHTITRMQRAHFERAVYEKRYLYMIEERLGL